MFTASVASCVDTLNPIANKNFTARAVLNHVCDGLYNIDAKTGQTYFGIAATNPIKINNLTYEIPLRDSIVYSDGAPLKPEDVINAFMLNIKDTQLGPIFSFIKDISKKDEKTLVLNLNYPYETKLKERLALVYIFPSTQSVASLNTQPLGTGMWAIQNTDLSSSGKIEFAKNPFYKGKFIECPAPMTWFFNPDYAQRASSISNKHVIVAEDIKETNVGDISSSGVNIDYVQGSSCAYFLFDCMKYPFNNVSVRKAIHYAINKNKIIDKVLSGHGSFSASYLPKNNENYLASNLPYDYNLEKSKSLLKEANVDIHTCKILIEDSWIKEIAPYMEESLQEIGIKAEFVESAFNQDNLSEIMAVNNVDFVIGSEDPSIFGVDVDSQINFWYGDNQWMSTISKWKLSDSTKWNTLNSNVLKARQALQQSESKSLWDQCLDEIYNNCAILPIFYRDIATAICTDKISGYKAMPSLGPNFIGSKLN